MTQPPIPGMCFAYPEEGGAVCCTLTMYPEDSERLLSLDCVTGHPVLAGTSPMSEYASEPPTTAVTGDTVSPTAGIVEGSQDSESSAHQDPPHVTPCARRCSHCERCQGSVTGLCIRARFSRMRARWLHRRASASETTVTSIVEGGYVEEESRNGIASCSREECGRASATGTCKELSADRALNYDETDICKEPFADKGVHDAESQNYEVPFADEAKP